MRGAGRLCCRSGQIAMECANQAMRACRRRGDVLGVPPYARLRACIGPCLNSRQSSMPLQTCQQPLHQAPADRDAVARFEEIQHALQLPEREEHESPYETE
jgi:hypothetical protein